MILPTDPGWDGFGMRGRVLTTDVILIFAFFEKKSFCFFNCRESGRMSRLRITESRRLVGVPVEIQNSAKIIINQSCGGFARAIPAIPLRRLARRRAR